MTDFITIIGTIASVGSIPLAIYLYIKSSEQKIIKVRREIVKTLSYQLKDDKHLSTFEIQAVINSKLREHKLKKASITPEEVIEDLIAETIANPLIDNERKNFFLNNFKSLLSKSELYDTIEELSTKQPSDKSEPEMERRLLELVKRQQEHRDNLEKRLKKTSDNFSSIFGLIATITTVVISVLTILGDELIVGKFFDFANDKKELVNFLISALAGIATMITTVAIKKAINKKEK
ncbi:hypothetical protein [Roseivirga pacifica]